MNFSRVVVVALAMASCLSAQQQAPTRAPLAVFCSLDRPVIGTSGIVRASATADAKNRGDVTYQWTASEGQFVVDGQASGLKASGSEVQWSAKGAAAGRHQLTLNAHDASGQTGSCSLTIAVSTNERGNAQSSVQDLARAFLSREESETTGYGLYSYLLIPDGCASSQAGALRERCVVFLKQALLQIRDDKDMKDADVAPPSHLNITYLLVKRAIPPDITADLDRHLDDQVSWILTNYDYARCHKLLLLMKDPLNRPGPLVISTREPVFYANSHPSAKSRGTPEQLYQDYSDVPLNVMPLWFERFRSQSFQEKFWEPGALNNFAWSLRKYLAIAGLGLPTAEASVKAIGPK